MNKDYSSLNCFHKDEYRIDVSKLPKFEPKFYPGTEPKNKMFYPGTEPVDRMMCPGTRVDNPMFYPGTGPN